MKKFEAQKAYLVFLFILSVFIVLPGCGGGELGGGSWNKPNAPAIMTAYAIGGVNGTINEPARTIAVIMPFGTDLTTLVATFTHTGTGVNVGAAGQTSGTTANNFTNPVVYTVTGADGTSAAYTVNVTVASADAKAITAYSFVGFPGFPGTINESAKTIEVTLPSGTVVTNLKAVFATTGKVVNVGAAVQTSSVTANDFTNPVAYTVTAANGSTTAVPYTVTVTVASASAKAITAFSFVGFTAFPGTINELAKTIAVTLPFGTNVTALTAKFTTTGTVVKIGAVVQTSEAAPTNDFTTPKAYTVTAADGSTTAVPYTVTVTLAPSTLKTITAFSFVGFTAFPGTINELAKTIAVTLPFGTDVTALTAKFTTTGTVVKIGGTIQTSEAAPTNDFTTSKAYAVTAADGSTTAVPYTVTVTLAPSTLKTITAFSFVGFTGFPGTVNELAKTIAVTLPFGTDVTALTAKFTTTGTVVKIGTVVQTSEAPPTNNFTTSKAYAVTAADGSTTAVPYTVTVTLAPSTLKTITAFSFVGFTAYPGTIDEALKTIAVTLPFGTDVTALTAKFTTTGTVVKIGAVVQTSEAPPTNNFTTSKAYTVTAADGSTTAVPYTVTVSLAPSTLKTITAYSFVGFTAYPGTIDEALKTIAVTLPFGTDVTALTAKFTTTGTVVKIGAVVQTSEAPPTNNFTTSKAYTVTAADGVSTATYTVTVTLAPNPAKAITAYSFVGFASYPGTVDEALKTITVRLPLGTDVTALTAKFTTTGTVVKIGAVVQTSEAPPTNDFTLAKAYTVTAADLSTATYTVTVIVTKAPALGAAAPFGGFGGNATLTNDGLNTIINGDIGVNAASTKITGLRDSGGNVYTVTPSNDGLVTGLIYTLTAPPGSVAAAAVTQARADALVAFNAISPANLPGGIDVSSLAQCPSCGGAGQGPGQLAGRTLPPGVYLSTTGTYGIGITVPTAGNLILDAQGDPDAVWVFQTAAGTGTLTVGVTGPATPAVPIQVLFKDGIGKSKNVFWYVPGGATIGTGSTMLGTMLADASITISTTGGGPPPNAVTTTLNGRAICLTAGVTMTNTVINVPAP